MKVLVAEDSSLLRAQIIRMFSDLDEIEVVGEPRDAVETCRAIPELKPDVVILDILMRGGNGIGVLKKIMGADYFPVVIVLTDSSSPPYRTRSTEAGAEFFLDKSTEFGKVREIMQSLIGRFNVSVDNAREDSLVGQT